MALDVFFGLDLGEPQSSVVTDSTTPGKDVEVAYDSAEITNTNDLRIMLQTIIDQIDSLDFPPI